MNMVDDYTPMNMVDDYTPMNMVDVCTWACRCDVSSSPGTA
jgi:hypothetical protein